MTIQPIRYAWNPHGMRPSETDFGPTRYINEREHDRIVAALQADLAAARAERDQAMRERTEIDAVRESEHTKHKEICADLAAARALLKKAQKYIYTDTILYDRIDAALAGKDAT